MIKITGRDTADYEASEAVAIASGKQAFSKAPWLFDRRLPKSKGFFVELRDCPVSPEYAEAWCVDGVGTKIFYAAMMNDYRKPGIDGIAMNANDLATIMRAYPSSLCIYLACQTPVEEKHMGEIMEGFVSAAQDIAIENAPWELNIGKLETASLDEIIGSVVQDKGTDFGIVMGGYIRKEHIPNLDPQPGHKIVGVSSTGLHSNGHTGARHVLFVPDIEYRDEWKPQYKGRFHPGDMPDILKGQSVLEALAVPTALYLADAVHIGEEYDNLDIFGINITGNGLHNFNRAGHNVSFEITDPLPLLPIHYLLAQESGWSPEVSYKKQNNGMGFAFIVPNQKIGERIVNYLNGTGKFTSAIVGEVAKSNDAELRTTIHKPYEGKGPLNFVGYTS